MKSFYYYFIAIFLFLDLSCSTDNPNNNSGNSLNTLNCKVNGDMKMNFNSSSVNCIKYQTGQTLLFAEMHLNPNETYSLQIKYDDTTNGFKYNLYGSEPLTYFEIKSITSVIRSYCTNVSGNISFTDKTNDSLKGTFNFAASFIDTVNSVTRTINITDGNFVIKKITK
jgi:hypothetical protein